MMTVIAESISVLKSPSEIRKEQQICGFGAKTAEKSSLCRALFGRTEAGEMSEYAIEELAKAQEIAMKQQEEIAELKAEVARLKGMIYCTKCGYGALDNPYIDEYGEGPFCESCKGD
jgi:membrane protease subunit (stomatin/prohibitin family)